MNYSWPEIRVLHLAEKIKFTLLASFRASKTTSTVIESILTGLAGQVCLLASGIVIARLLGPSGRGYFALLVLFPTILVQLGLLGLPQALANQLAQCRSHARPLLRDIKACFVVQWLLIGAAHAIILILFTRNESTDIVIAGIMTAVSVPGIILQAYGLAGLQGLQMYRAFNILRLSVVAGWALTALVLFCANQSALPFVAGSWAVVQFVFALFIFSTFNKNGLRQSTPTKGSTYSRPDMLRFGLKGMLGHIGPLETFRLDQLVVGLFFNPMLLGIYVVAQAFTNTPRFIAQSIGYVAFPTIAGMEQQRVRSLSILNYVFAVAAVSIPIAGLLMLFMPELVYLLFGDEFSAAIPIARILLVGAVFGALRKVIVEALRGLSFPQFS